MIKNILQFSTRNIKKLVEKGTAKSALRLVSTKKVRNTEGQVQIHWNIIKIENKYFAGNETKVVECPEIMQFEGDWPKDVQEKFLKDMMVIENFITLEEERGLLDEIEPYLKRMRYERDHWDDAIQGFRETERKSWYPQNKEIINKIIAKAFPSSSNTLPHIHVLDLEATGKLFLKSLACTTRLTRT